MRKSHYNIAHILPWNTVGGTELATLRIAQGIEGKEFRSTVFYLPEADTIGKMFAEKGFETATYPSIEPSYRHPQPFLRASLSLARKFKRRNISLVHCADLDAAYYAAFAGKMAGLSVLCHIRNRSAKLTRRDKSFLYAVNRFAFVSRDTWKNFGYKVPPHRGIVVYDGIEVKGTNVVKARESVRQKYDIPATAKVVGMVARFAPQKDYATLARAASRVITAEKNVRFLIVGDYSGTAAYQEHYEEVKRMLAANAVSEYFIFTGFQADVSRFLDAMDIFVLSTHFEGLPLVILEAMAQGKPVLATAVDGIPEVVVHEKTGLLHQHQNHEQLSAHLLALIKDNERAARFGEAGRQAVKRDWSGERFARDMKNLYRQMLSGKKSVSERRLQEDWRGEF